MLMRFCDEEIVFGYVIVDEDDSKYKNNQIATDLIDAHWLATGAAPRN